MKNDSEHSKQPSEKQDTVAPEVPQKQSKNEIGGPKGPEPTRFGDWEVAGRCSDF